MTASIFNRTAPVLPAIVLLVLSARRVSAANTTGSSNAFAGGYFQGPAFASLGEALMKSPAGAVAVWSSSAMTHANSQAPMNAEFYRLLFATASPRLGDAAVKAKAATPHPDVRRSWMLFGDPTMRFK